MLVYSATIAERFWPKVSCGTSVECWEWNGCRNKSGYGFLYVGYSPSLKRGIAQPATRVCWFLTHGGWPPEELFVLHTCDNPPCVNIAHLFLGTRQDNMRDMARKGRHSSHTHPELVPRGERHHNAKITDAQYEEMLALWWTGTWTQHQLAKRYGVHQATIWERLQSERLRRGDRYGNDKWAVEQTADMLRLYVTGEYTNAALAQRYGVSSSSITRRIHKLLPAWAIHGKEWSMSGELHPNAKLTDAQYLEMLALRATGTWTQERLAQRYGMSQTAIGDRLRHSPLGSKRIKRIV